MTTSPSRLKGRADAPASPQPKASGWHPVDGACEYAGTAVQLAAFYVVALLEAPESPARRAIRSSDLRLIRRSGAHLNPAVTFGFWLRRHTPGRDAIGYAFAQSLGALTAAAAFAVIWGAWAACRPDIVADAYAALWCYLVGPCAGALLAAGCLWRSAGGRR